jgi:hypothetical protein
MTTAVVKGSSEGARINRNVKLSITSREVIFNGLKEARTVEILTLSGNTVASIPVSGSRARWDWTPSTGKSPAEGVYLFRVKGEKVVGSGKFMLPR